MSRTFPLSTIQLLIDFGGNVNYYDDWDTPLGYACQIWNVELVELLLKAGADPDYVGAVEGEPIEIQESVLRFYVGELWLWGQNDRTKDTTDLAKIVALMEQYSPKYKDAATTHLITEIAKVASEPYSEWKIGITNNGYMDSERYINVTVFNPDCNESVLTAYNHYAGIGMVAIPFTGKETKYLYMYKIGGATIPEGIF